MTNLIVLFIILALVLLIAVLTLVFLLIVLFRVQERDVIENPLKNLLK